ncbi:MAG: glycosyltransferase [Paludibacteraceae bacterium]
MSFFSIIIPTYNSASTLQKCLESVISQIFENYEVIIVNGVSNDKTLQLAHDFNDDRIRVLCEPDEGIYDAMNKGIKLAKGEWLYFSGSDDSLYDSSVLTNVFSLIMNAKVDVVYGDVLMEKINEVYDGEFTFEKLKD